MLLVVILFVELRRVITLVDPNQLTYAYVTEQIMKDELKYLTQIPKDIPHNFSVSFLFPNLKWDAAFNDTDSDNFHCFTDKIKRRVRSIFVELFDAIGNFPYAPFLKYFLHKIDFFFF